MSCPLGRTCDHGFHFSLFFVIRSGDAEMTNTPDGAILVTAELGLKNLQGHYK